MEGRGRCVRMIAVGKITIDMITCRSSDGWKASSKGPILRKGGMPDVVSATDKDKGAVPDPGNNNKERKKKRWRYSRLRLNLSM